MRGRKFLTSPASRHDGESDPTKELEEVVGKRHPIKAVSIRNGTLAASLRSQRPEV